MGTINTTIIGEVTLSSSGSYSSPLTITASGAVDADASAAIYGPGTQAWTVVNAGIVTNSSATGNGIELDAGGSVTNNAGGTIAAYYGVVINGTAGAVTNAGYIQGAGGSLGVGVYLAAGGTITNQAGGTITGHFQGVYVSGAAGGVTNAGYIRSTIGTGVAMRTAGAVINQAGGTIVGADVAVEFRYVTGTVTNAGTISGLGIEGVRLWDGGTVVNQNGGVISGFNFGITVLGAPGYVTNAGYIVGTGYAAAIALTSGGTVVNQAGGTIAGPDVGVICAYVPGTITNAGTVSGGSDGVRLLAGGLVTNQSGGRIVGTSYSGVYITGGDGTVSNAGYIQGTGGSLGVGVYLAAGGAVTNQAGGTIAGTYRGVSAAGGTVANEVGGKIIGGQGVYIDQSAGGVINAGYIRGNILGVELAAGGTVVNAGWIGVSNGNGVLLDNGGTVINQAGGTIQVSGNYGIYVSGAAGSATNAGSIHSGSLSGVAMRAGGTVTNQAGGAIVGNGFGVEFRYAPGYAPGTVFNAGTIRGFGLDGVDLQNGGVVVNQQSGMISGNGFGVFISGAPGYVTNAGYIVAAAVGVFLRAGGMVANQAGGTITAGNAGVMSILAAVTVTNAGTISGGNFYGVALYAGGVVTNEGGGRIVSTSNVGVYIAGGDGTVTNAGYIQGTGGGLGIGVYLAAGGTVTNQAGGLIEGKRKGVHVLGSAGTVTNLGSISGGVGVAMFAGGLIVNGASGASGAVISSGSLGGEVGLQTLFVPATVINYGTIAGGLYGVQSFAGGTFDNMGLISGGSHGAGFQVQPATVTNSGTITARYTGLLLAGGTLDNSGLIAASDTGVGIYLNGAARIVNHGSIAGQVGIYPFGFGTPAETTLTNYGAITGIGNYARGVFLNGSGSLVENFGTIAAPGTGGQGLLINGGSVSNSATGLIAGQRYGAGASGTMLNAGTIAATGAGGIGIVFGGSPDTLTNSGAVAGGGLAVSFSDGNDRLVLKPGFSFSGGIDGGSGSDTLELGGGAGAPLTVDYNALGLTDFEQVRFSTGGYATLRITNSSGTLGVAISGFDATTETIDLTGIGSDGRVTNNDTLTDRVTVTGSLGSVTLQFDSIDGLPFTTSSDGAGGTNFAIACFCRGTLILTPDGEVPVEKLAIGDTVCTLSGVRPIKWVGKRAYDPRFVAGNRNVLPIRIEAGALAHGVPARDLWVSPEHALYLRQVLVPAQLLVNDATITQPESVERLEYFHIELGTHDVILADGAAAETYVDCDNRNMFHNEREFALLYPGEMPSRWEFCARRMAEGAPELAAIRRAVLARVKLFDRFTDDPDLHLVVDGIAVQPQLIANRRLYRFAVPAGGRSIVLASRSTVPIKIGHSSADGRRLGVAVERIVLRGTGLSVDIEPDCPALCNGFHDAEPGCRWTDGKGHLPAGLIAAFGGDFVVEVQLADTELVYGLTTRAAADAGGSVREGIVGDRSEYIPAGKSLIGSRA